MTTKTDGGAAFPVVHPDGMGVQYFGLSVRDYFAAKAMQALIRELANTEQADEEMQKLGLVEGDFDRLVAKCSYDYADAMLAAREAE